MAFVLSKAETFKYAVKVKQAAQSGRLETFEFLAEFKRRKEPEIKEIMRAGDAKVIEEWVGWSGIKALVKEGEVQIEQDLPFTPENKAACSTRSSTPGSKPR
jgi:hypothetical protein